MISLAAIGPILTPHPTPRRYSMASRFIIIGSDSSHTTATTESSSMKVPVQCVNRMTPNHALHRTATRVTACATARRRLSDHRHRLRHAPQSLNLGSVGPLSTPGGFGCSTGPHHHPPTFVTLRVLVSPTHCMIGPKPIGSIHGSAFTSTTCAVRSRGPIHHHTPLALGGSALHPCGPTHSLHPTRPSLEVSAVLRGVICVYPANGSPHIASCASSAEQSRLHVSFRIDCSSSLVMVLFGLRARIVRVLWVSSHVMLEFAHGLPPAVVLVLRSALVAAMLPPRCTSRTLRR